MSTLVSKKTLPLMSLHSIEGETCRKRTAQPPQSLDRFFPAAITAYLELSRPSDTHLDLVSVLEIQSLDDRCGQTDGQAIAPLRYLHEPSLDILKQSISKVLISMTISDKFEGCPKSRFWDLGSAQPISDGKAPARTTC